MEKNTSNYSVHGLFTLSIRLVVGWTYFSAFWRRLILENKLNPDDAGYIGIKFNHFLPNSLGIKPMIEYLVTHPDALWWAMVVFTIIEAIVGLCVMLGFLTRLMSVGIALLALAILLGSGWLGSTCLDEWQIGVLGISAGFTLFLTGSGYYSLDHYIIKKNWSIIEKKWFVWIGSGDFPIRKIKTYALVGSIMIFALTLFTNQYFHGGVYGKLHNLSVKPNVEISDVYVVNNHLLFQIYRTEGIDVYGSFLIGIKLQNKHGETVLEMNGEDLSRFPSAQIKNKYVAQIKAGKHSLVIPVGAKAVLDIDLNGIPETNFKGYTLTLIDISGIEWSCSISK